MEQKAVVDRIVDGEHAVLLVGDEQAERIVPTSRLPAGATPGTWLRVRFHDGKLLKAAADTEETQQTETRVQQKLEKLRNRGRHFKPEG